MLWCACTCMWRTAHANSRPCRSNQLEGRHSEIIGSSVEILKMLFVVFLQFRSRLAQASLIGSSIRELLEPSKVVLRTFVPRSSSNTFTICSSDEVPGEMPSAQSRRTQNIQLRRT